MTSLNLKPRTVVFPAGGTLRTCTVNPADYVAARLISELADAWKARAEEFQLAPSTVSGRASTLRGVGEFLTEKSDRSLTLHTSRGAEVTERLHDWEKAMIKKYPRVSKQPKMVGYDIRGNVAYYLEANDLDNSWLSGWAESPVLDGSPLVEQPLDEFSNHERQQLESVCRQIIRDTEARLSRGDELLAAGSDPRRNGWDRVENVLWALRNLPYKRSYYVHLVGSQRQLDPAEVDLMSGRFVDPLLVNKPPLLIAVGAFLAPDPEFLLAVRVLLHLQTGWAPEETVLLRRRDVEFRDDSVRIRAPKNRAHRVRWHTLQTSSRQPWGWKAGDVLRRAADALRHVHALSPEDSSFWMTAAKVSPYHRAGEWPHWVVRPHTFGAVVSNLSELIRRRDLSISKPHDMRRLRKTVKSARAALLGTLGGAAGDDHSIEVFRDHYAQTTTVRTISAQTVIRAQQKVLKRAVEGPVLVTATARDVAATDDGDPEVVRLATQVAQETATEQELTLSACRDPHDGPLSQPGELCHASPSMCLQCRNAVIFREHLPRLLAYENTLDSLKKTLPPIAYSEFYGQQTVNLKSVIDQFTADDVARARERATLHRPLGERAEQ